jgi:hypothetical protein
MSSAKGDVAKFLVWTVALGVALNALGWLGNNLLLGAAWDAANAGAAAGLAPPWPPLVREIVTLLSDFI